ncbi:HPP family protein [Rhizorhabdus wittichii]
MLIDHPNGTVAKLRRKLVPCSAHHSSFSQIGASGKPGTLQPQLRATYPRAVICGHLIAFSLTLFCHAWLMPAVIVAAMALVAMQITATVHPPAALTPFLLAAHPDLVQRVVLPLFFGCLVAVAVSGLLRRMTS